MPSRRSQASPGSRQGRTASAGRFKAEVRRKRGEEQARDRIHEQGDVRRPDVYRSDVTFAAKDAFRPLPPRGPQRDALVREVAEAKARKESDLAIACRLGFEVASIAYLRKQYGIARDGSVARG